MTRYADANGNIDVRTLTCGQIADTSAPEAETLLLWVTGWYNGVAKKRAINVPRVKADIRNVIDYCRLNRALRVTQAMDVVLKDARR